MIFVLSRGRVRVSREIPLWILYGQGIVPVSLGRIPCGFYMTGDSPRISMENHLWISCGQKLATVSQEKGPYGLFNLIFLSHLGLYKFKTGVSPIQEIHLDR